MYWLRSNGNLIWILLAQGIIVYVVTSIVVYIMKKIPLVKEIV